MAMGTAEAPTKTRWRTISGEGRFMVTTGDEMRILASLAGPVTRLVEHAGVGRVAESWKNGFLAEMAGVSQG